MAIYTKAPSAEYQWLSSDRTSEEFAALRNIVDNGQYGRELDTGREFYFSEQDKDWVEFERPEVVAIRDLLQEFKDYMAEHGRYLRQIRNGIGELAGESDLPDDH